jgi:hypothetical protein
LTPRGADWRPPSKRPDGQDHGNPSGNGRGSPSRFVPRQQPADLLVNPPRRPPESKQVQPRFVPRQLDTCLLVGMWLLLCLALAAGTHVPRASAQATGTPQAVSQSSGDTEVIRPQQPASLRAPSEAGLGTGDDDQPRTWLLLAPAYAPPAPKIAPARLSLLASRPARSFVSLRTQQPRAPPKGVLLKA